MRQEENGGGGPANTDESERQRLLNNANQSNQQANYNTSSQPIHQPMVSFSSLYYINISLCSHNLIYHVHILCAYHMSLGTLSTTPSSTKSINSTTTTTTTTTESCN